MLKIISLAAVAIVSLAGAAEASTYVVALNPIVLNSTVSIDSTPLQPNLALTSAVLTPLAGIETASVSGKYLAPENLNGAPYLYVGGGKTASATFSLNSIVFGMTWGSIDTYNVLQLTTDTNQVYTINGGDLITVLQSNPALPNLLIRNGVQGGENTGYQADVLFQVLSGKIISAVLTSKTAAFEVANVSSIPLPPALLLFGSGLMALAGVARKKMHR